MRSSGSDVIIVGAGLVGLCCARALARRSRTVTLVRESRAGEASSAAAGMLAPSVERSDGPAHTFAVAAREMYPAFLEQIADEVGVRVPLNRLGVLQVALTEKGVSGLRKTMPAGSEWVTRAELAALEPTLGHALGAVLNPEDGAVDNTILMHALEEVVQASPFISIVDGAATAVAGGEVCTVQLASGDSMEASAVVLAPGAWGGTLRGASALQTVAPSRGQLIAFEGIGLRHVVYGPRGYLVPRGSSVIAGSTMENAGFASVTTSEGLARVESAAWEVAPALSIAPVQRAWAGLRPVTPDMLPVIGPDPAAPNLIYACGHARNGILLGPITGEVVAALVAGEPVGHDLSQFRPGRF